MSSVIDLTCDEVKAQAGAYAIGTLRGDERAALRAHLAVCASCAEYCASFAPVTAALLNGAPPLTPPAALRAALMQKVQPPAAQTQGRFGWLGAMARIAMVGALLAVIVLANTYAANFITINNPIARIINSQQAQQLARQLAADPTATQLPMYARAAAPQASGTLRFKAEDKVGVLEAQALPALPSDRAYQLWLVNPDGTRDTGAIFRVSDASEWITVNGAKPLNQYVRFGISIEPAGGSPAPTGPGALSSQPA